MTGRPAPGTSSGRPQSAVLVPVPDAEGLVGRWRLAHDPVAPAGVPAHITLVVPWLAPAAIDDGAVAELAAVLEGVPAWSFDLARVAWFGRRVLWLAPEPAAPFRELTLRLAERFGTPPWGGAFAEVVPHLTVGHAGPGDDLAAAAAAVGAGLPLTCRAEEVWVMVGDGTTWQRRASVALGGSSSADPSATRPSATRPSAMGRSATSRSAGPGGWAAPGGWTGPGGWAGPGGPAERQ